MGYFPIFQDISGRKVLIVGGGRVALRKAEKLLPFEPEITVVAPEIRSEFENLGVELVRRSFCDSDIAADTALVIAACNDEAVNSRIYHICRESAIPVNVVDNPAYCTFLFPSLIKRGRLTVGISTSGASPSGAIWVKENLEQLLPEEFDAILNWLEQQRQPVKENFGPEALRALCLKGLFAACMEKGGVLSDEERDAVLRKVVSGYGAEE